MAWMIAPLRADLLSESRTFSLVDDTRLVIDKARSSSGSCNVDEWLTVMYS
jgi:hypothetical protein